MAQHFPLGDPQRPINMLGLSFIPDGVRAFIENWEDFARQAIQRLHREAPSPEDVRTGMERVVRHPDLPDNWWAFDVRHAVRPAVPLTARKGDIRLSFFTIIASVAVPADAFAQELKVETLSPADQATEDCLRALG